MALRLGFVILLVICAVLAVMIFVHPDTELAKAFIGIKTPLALSGAGLAFLALIFLKAMGKREAPIRLIVGGAILVGLLAVALGMVGFITQTKGRGSRDEPHGRTDILNFDEVYTQGSQGHVEANDYLAEHGISISQVDRGSVVILNDNAPYGGLSFAAPSAPNVLTQIDCNGNPESFSLRLKEPATRVTFFRAKLLAAGTSGITHPAWSSLAFDAQGRLLSHAGETLIRNEGAGHNEPAQMFTLQGPGIATLKFSSDYLRDDKPFAAFCGVLIDDLTIFR